MNGEITYSVSGYTGGEAVPEFSVEAATGRVRVAAPLDAEARAEFHLLVTASDAGRPPLLTTAHLFITGQSPCITRLCHISTSIINTTTLPRVIPKIKKVTVNWTWIMWSWSRDK